MRPEFSDGKITNKYFNPRTHVGCDHPLRCRLSSRSDFNPRTHVGCDTPEDTLHPVNGISIHAPTWGATPCRCGHIFPHRHFNPRTHVGCDIGLSQGWRLKLDFNPRTHVGCDTPEDTLHPVNGISIHAPTWGATSESKTPVLTKRFQSTHPRGVRHVCAGNKIHNVIFQSTHPRGVRRRVLTR